ncbi:uncharacterized protein LOC110240482 [Exaiptasia diaphana]|uniref:Uncharacterized protein n=1 Tax=Exaiptasia diaphana TaxID=2652724 RepID=A0A913XCL5_EXADI|nr:uncharacterized protein LOC110240482 [Exaiptasia diaphana]KXJ13307.1 hypothetical protein AC249_AIPGENE18846 [Exaiptasia diaphana]
MAAAARCVRFLLRNPSNVNPSSRLVLRCLNGSKSVKTATPVSLRTSLKEAGMLNSSRNYSLVSKANNFTNTIRPVSALCNISISPPLNLDTTGGSGEGIDGSGDDDGETWSQNSEEGYIGDDT